MLPYEERAKFCFSDDPLVSNYSEPKTYRETISGPDASEWTGAMHEEADALKKNNVFEEETPTEVQRPLESRWVYKIKENPTTKAIRRKARLVAKGFKQRPDVDFSETFVPVASMSCIRLLLAICLHFKMLLLQFDVKTAFLNGDLEKDIYLKLPEDFPDTRKIVKLRKSLHGLKQSPRCWNVEFKSFLLDFNLQQSTYDPCLFYSEDKRIFIVIYVDDGLIAADNQQILDRLKSHLSENLEVKFEEATSFLGVQINRSGNKMVLYQDAYIDRSLDRFEMADCNPALNLWLFFT